MTAKGEETRPTKADIPKLLALLEDTQPKARWKVHRDLVWAYFSGGNYQKSIESYKACRDLVREEDLTPLILQASEALQEFGEMDEAASIVQKRLKALEKKGLAGDPWAARLHLRYAYVRWRQGNFDEAMDQCQMALAIFTDQKEVPRNEEVRVLTTMGLILWEKADYAMALRLLGQAKDVATDAGLDDKIAECDNNMGLVNYQMGNYSEALRLFERAMVRAKKVDDKYLQALIEMNIGIVFADRGDLNKAKSQFQTALKLNEEMENFVGTALAVSNLGLLLIDMGEMEEGRKALEESMSQCRQMKEKWVQASNRIGMSRFYIWKRDLKLARFNAEKTLGLAEEMKAKELKGIALRELGRIDELEGKKDKAKKDLEDALAIFESINSRFETAKTLISLGRFMNTVLGEPDKAKPLFQRAKGLAKELGANGLLKDIEKTL